MKILIVGDYASDKLVSMAHFERMLVAGHSGAGHEVRVIRPRQFFGALSPAPAGIGKWLGYADKFLLFPRELRAAAAWADIVHLIDHGLAVYTRFLRDIPHVVTCHDLLAVRSALGEFSENRTGWMGRRYQRWITRGLRQARLVACVSEKTRADLLRLTGIESRLAPVIAMALHHPYARMPEVDACAILTRLGIALDAAFLLSVGGNHWYHNRAGILRIFECLLREPGCRDFRLVLAGEPLAPEHRAYVQAQGLESRLLELTGLDNEDLRALYSRAKALLFPDLQAGFGWPIIEAQACGCPVITSNRPPLTETGGSAAIYVDPERPDDAAREIARRLPESAELSAAGLANARRFPLDKMLASYIGLYEEARREP